MRFFIALEIPELSKSQIRSVQQGLKALIPQIRLADTSKIHLTIAFPGDQADSLQNKLTQVIQEAVLGIDPFEVTPSFLGAFPNLDHPYTFWIGVKGGVLRLHLLQKRIKQALEDLNLPIDKRPYTPHIAIAKIQNYSLPKVMRVRVEELMQQPFNPIYITKVKLFESVPEGGFHTHNTLAEIELKG